MDTPRGRTDDQILAERDVLDKKMKALRDILTDLLDAKHALGYTSQERNEHLSFLGQKSDKERFFEGADVDNGLWMLFSEGLLAYPFDRFNFECLLKRLKKDKKVDWSPLIPPSDRLVLSKYGFDKEGERRHLNRCIRAIPFQGMLSLDQIQVLLNQYFPNVQFNLEPLRERFVQRWKNRLALARKEQLYQTSAPHKRKLEALEASLVVYEQERETKKAKIGI